MSRYFFFLFCCLLHSSSHANSTTLQTTPDPLVEKLTLASQEMQVVSSDGIVFTRDERANKDAIVHISIKAVSVADLPEYMVTAFSNYSVDHYRAPLYPLRIYHIATEVQGSAIGLNYHRVFRGIT